MNLVSDVNLQTADTCLQIVPMKTLTLSELSEHDGSNPDKPMYLAIRGTVFDVTLGEQSYCWQHSTPVSGIGTWMSPLYRTIIIFCYSTAKSH